MFFSANEEQNNTTVLCNLGDQTTTMNSACMKSLNTSHLIAMRFKHISGIVVIDGFKYLVYLFLKEMWNFAL